MLANLKVRSLLVRNQELRVLEGAQLQMQSLTYQISPTNLIFILHTNTGKAESGYAEF
jgi:hypothetical protein